MSKIITYFIFLIQSLLFLTIIPDLLLILVSKLKKPQTSNNNKNLTTYLFLIPAYQDKFETLLRNVNAILNLNYPKDKIKIILIADCLDNFNESKLPKILKVLKVNLEVHSKINSLKSTLSEIPQEIDFIVILDSDNIIHPEFLIEVSKLTDRFKVIQGKRVPLNIYSKFAVIDSLSDLVYEKIDHYYPSLLNLSSTITGSGFVIARNLFLKIIPGINVLGGFDKILQSILTLKNIKIGYAPSAIVYDQKVNTADVYVRQRKRWIYYYFYNAIKYGFKIFLKGLSTFNLNKIYMGLKSLRPPFGLVGFAYLCFTILSLFLNKFLFHVSIIFFKAFVTYILILLFDTNQLKWKVIQSLPILIVNQLKAFFTMYDARKDSLKTKHN